MPWITPGTATAGEVLTAAFWNTNVRDNTSDVDERLRASKTKSKQRTVANANSFSNPTTFTVLPNATDKAAADVTFTKALGTASELIIQVTGSINFTSGATQVMAWGARCVLSGGGTTTVTCAEQLFPAAPSRQFFGGAATGTALAAGTYTISPVFRAAGASALSMDVGSDHVSITVTESPI